MVKCWRLFICTYMILIATSAWNFHKKLIDPTLGAAVLSLMKIRTEFREKDVAEGRNDQKCGALQVIWWQTAHSLALRTVLFWTPQENIMESWKAGKSSKAKWKNFTYILLYPPTHLITPIVLREAGTNTSIPNKQSQVSALMILSSYFKASQLFTVTEAMEEVQSIPEYCHVTTLPRISVCSLRQCHYHDLLTSLIEISLTMHSTADRIIVSKPASAFSRALAEKGRFEGK